MMTGTPWPHLVADLTAKRDALTRVIDLITTNFSNEIAQQEASPNGQRGDRRRRTVGRPRKTLRKNGRTDGRTDGAKGAPSPDSEPP
jgi:hypothetical protein